MTGDVRRYWDVGRGNLDFPIGLALPCQFTVRSAYDHDGHDADRQDDLFDDTVPDWFIGAVLSTASATPRHRYTIATVNPDRVAWAHRLPNVDVVDTREASA